MANPQKTKRNVEKEVFRVSLDFVQPPSKGMAVYMANRRTLEKQMDNPAFRREFVQQYNGFADFLRKYDLQTADLSKFLNTDMRLFVKKIPKR
jgi:hypothetical protein